MLSPTKLTAGTGGTPLADGWLSGPSPLTATDRKERPANPVTTGRVPRPEFFRKCLLFICGYLIMTEWKLGKKLQIKALSLDGYTYYIYRSLKYYGSFCVCPLDP